MQFRRCSVVLLCLNVCVSSAPLNNDLNGQLQDFENRLSKLENKWEQFSKFHGSFEDLRAKRQAVDPHVSFSAVLDHRETSIGIGQKIVYNQVLHNDGNAYNEFTGIFTVPANGVYLFTYFVGELHDNEVYLKLMADGQNEVDAVAEGIDPRHNDQGGNAAILKLTAGQSVWIEVYNVGNTEIDAAADYLYNSFSGALIYGL